jgi:hypothetical protein
MKTKTYKEIKMKTILLTLLASTLISGQAMANEELTIHCHSKDSPSFEVWITAGSFEGSFSSKTAPADVTISGPRLHLPYSTTLQKYSIQTRTVLGIGFYAQLNQSSSINLQNITWAPEGWEKQLGFHGTYTYGDHEIALVCKYM